MSIQPPSGLLRQKIKFEAKTQRVKNICFHPSKPWVIIAMRSGVLELWDYNLKISLAKFEEHDEGVRGVDFHPQLPLFVSGGDDHFVKVWDYKQKRCLFTLKGHIDYIRTTYFHNQLPWILSACDDQTMRIWNYQSRACVNIITGHSHYVMCAQFHQQKNLIVSASLDSTVRIWDYSILKKKLTQSKNLSAFIGIQIECIKVLEGHQRGVNWVCFHPSQNLIASGSDDRKIKLWKYTNEVAWQHSTLTGHKNNVSCVMFDKKTGFLFSNSQDKTTRIWDIQSKTQVNGHRRQGDRYWILNQSKSGSLLGTGHDTGFEIFEVNKEIVPHGMMVGALDEIFIIFAQGMKGYIYDASKKTQKQQLYQYVPKNPNSSFFIDRIIMNSFDNQHFMVQINQEGVKNFIIKKKQSYLNFPLIKKTFQGLDACFISHTQVAILNKEEISIITLFKDDDRKTNIKLKKDMNILKIFSSAQQNVLILATANCLAQFHVKNGKILAQLTFEQPVVKSVVFGFDKIAVITEHQIIITNNEFQTITTLRQKFPIESAFWSDDDLLIYTTSNHWKYSLMNGETGLLKTLQKPFHLLKKIKGNKFLSFNDQDKIFEIDFPPCLEIEFKRAVLQKNWQKTKQLIKQAVGQNKKYFVSYLVQKGLASIALDMVEIPEEKFSLAIQATNFQLAFEICNKINTPDYWKLLGDQALKQGIYEAYELANQKLKNFDKLNFLYSLQSNTQKLEKVQKIVNKMSNPMLSFNVALFLNKHEEMQKILRDCGYDQLAALTEQARQDPIGHSDLLKRLGSSPLEMCQPQGQPDFSNWPLNIVDAEEEETE